jgi:hypothetical protein
VSNCSEGFGVTLKEIETSNKKSALQMSSHGEQTGREKKALLRMYLAQDMKYGD